MAQDAHDAHHYETNVVVEARSVAAVCDRRAKEKREFAVEASELHENCCVDPESFLRLGFGERNCSKYQASGGLLSREVKSEDEPESVPPLASHPCALVPEPDGEQSVS